MAEFILVVFVLLLALGGYWIFVLMPRQQNFAKRQQLARKLKVGDEVITGGGLVGTVQRVDSDKGVAYVELAEGFQVRVLTAAILDLYDPDAIARDARMGQPEDDIE